MIRCGAVCYVSGLSSGDKQPVYCRLDDAHVGDHDGRLDGHGMAIRWSRVPAPTIFIRETFTLDPAPPPNAACVITTPAPESDKWVGGSSASIVDDIKAATEQIRKQHLAGPRRRSPAEQAHYDRLGRQLAEAAARLPHPESFPIQDAGPHPKDTDPFAEAIELAHRESAKALLSEPLTYPPRIQHQKDEG